MTEAQLKIGTKIKIGKEYSSRHELEEGVVIELTEGEFEYDNGLFMVPEYAPSVWNELQNEYDSIFHLFGNDLENFLDCEIIK